jgi:hypothetical protein
MEDFEQNVLEIKYHRGQMQVNLAEFMQNQTLSKINKLLKVIRSSYTPEQEEVIAAYCKDFLAGYEQQQKTLANLVVQYRTRAKELEPEIEKMKKFRDGSKRNGKRYKYYQEQINIVRGKVSDEMAFVRKHTAEFKQNERLKVKYEKVLENISQG